MQLELKFPYSLDTMKSHLYGSKHLKKKHQYEQNLMNEGKMVDDNTYIRSVPHPKLAPKKIPVPLKDKLSEIGNLQFWFMIVLYTIWIILRILILNNLVIFANLRMCDIGEFFCVIEFYGFRVFCDLGKLM